MFCPPYFFGVDIFVNAHGIHWMIGAIFVKFSQLILIKIIKIVATRCQILRLKCTIFNFGWGSVQSRWKHSPYPPVGGPHVCSGRGLMLRDLALLLVNRPKKNVYILS